MKELIRVLEELIVVFEELLNSAELKLNAVKANRIVEIDDCLKKEQAILMKLKGLENKREKIMKELGYENVTGNDVLNLLEDHQKEYRQTLDQLNHRVVLYRSIHQQIMVLMNCNVKQLEKRMIEKQNTI